MLAQIIISALARSLGSGARGSALTASASLGGRGSGRSGRGASISMLQCEAVQLDAIGYTEEELIAREIKTHREAIALYEDKGSGSDAQMRVFAQQILPQLQQHLAMLETMKSEFAESSKPDFVCVSGSAASDIGEHRDVPLGRRL